MVPLSEINVLINLVRDPLAWAADCRAQTKFSVEPEAQAAFAQLAEEFEEAATEIEALIATYEALRKRQLPGADQPPTVVGATPGPA